MKWKILGLVITVLGVTWLFLPSGQHSPITQFDSRAFTKYNVAVVQSVSQLDPGVSVAASLSSGDIITATTETNAPFLQRIHPGTKVVLGEISIPDEPTSYVLLDLYRLPWLAFAAGLAIFLLLVIAGRRGFYALAGLVLSYFLIIHGLTPRLLTGTSPWLAVLVVSALVATVGLALGHGLTRQTYLAILATIITLAIAAATSALCLFLLGFTGGGEQGAYYLSQLSPNFDFRGLMFAGIIIATLGVLDDVTTSQVATVREVHRANPGLGIRDLFFAGMRVGREHIVSLVNTLVLAYAGINFLGFLVLTATGNPWWVMLNSEQLGGEVIKALLGTSALVLAVPIATIITAWAAHTGWLAAQGNGSNHHNHLH